ncbi:OmpA family protein [Desulfonatronum sp. SC1]|uniref:OmpA family protein n=1 Tax=Desulfonatronum sp. SC1 TaxID=2109626 RepID=UPI002101CBB7|nr:OmpA family protein [Desulfonatronum sp. SC1]
MLRTDADLILYVVGHMDSVGGFDYNMYLIRKRAQAASQELTDRYGLDGTRLKSAGVGFLAPVAPNDDEDGRALNRRVELVKDSGRD